MTCISGPPCRPGKIAELSAFSCSAFIRMTPPRGPRRVLCVVVVTTSAMRHRVRVEAGGDQAGVVGHVDPEDGADFLGDLGEALEVDAQRVGGGAGDDDASACARGPALPSAS